jgi:hypothetical protein
MIRRVKTLIATVGAVLLVVLLVVWSAVAGSSARGPAIAYVSSPVMRPIVFVTGPGGTHRLGSGQEPSVAPDGLLIAASGLGARGPGLTLYATATGRLHSFFSDSGLAYPLAWSPDSRYLAVFLSGTARSATGLVVIDTATMTTTSIATGVIRGASFAPSGPDRLVYGYASTLPNTADVNLYAVNPDGSAREQLTADGDSLYPLWTVKGVVYFRETRSADAVPASMQLGLLHPAGSTQLTNMRFPAGYVRLLTASADGNRLIVQLVLKRRVGAGAREILAIDTVQLSPRRVRERKLLVDGISRDGRTLLVERAAQRSDRGVVETIPFGGGRPTQVANGDQAAWNG